MSLTAKSLDGFTVTGTDADLGIVRDVLFDEERWAVRYLVVETGLWLGGRTVLISAVSVSGIDWNFSRVQVKLTRRKVQRSPAIDTSKPVSRENETALFDYYGYTYYWTGSYLWGESGFPVPLPIVQPSRPAQRRPLATTQQTGCHLRSAKDICGCGIIDARDEIIGNVENLLFHDGDWSIMFIAANNTCGRHGEQVLLPPWMIRAIAAQPPVGFMDRTSIEDNMDRDEHWPKDPGDNLQGGPGGHGGDALCNSRRNSAVESLTEDYT